MKFKILIIISLFISANLLFAQNTKDAKLKLADSYEKQGDFENASRLFLELYESSSSDIAAFDGYIKNMKSLNKFSVLVDFVENHVKKYKNSKNYALLAGLYWRVGKVQDAEANWKLALETQPKTAEAYVQVISNQLELRLLEKAASTIELARKDLDSPNLFADELGKIYSSLGEIEKALREILTVFRATNNIAVAQGRIQAILSDSAAKSRTRVILEQYYQNSQNDLPLLRLMAWFYREIDDKNFALKLTMKLDEVTNAQGREVIQFGDQSRMDGDFEMAIKAYSIVIAMGKANPNTLTAYYGMARTYEQKNSQNQISNKKEIEDIINQYQTIIDDYPNQGIAFESQYRIALLRLKLGDRSKAEELLLDLTRRTPNSQLSVLALLELGRSALENEKSLVAKEYFSKARIVQQAQFQDKEKASYYLALIEYFTDSLESAKIMFLGVASNPKSPYANEALEKYQLISSCKDDMKELAKFAQAEYLAFQNKDEQAIKAFSATANLGVDELAERSYEKIGEIYYKLGDCANLNAALDSLNSKVPANIYGDRLTLLAGKCYSKSAPEKASAILKEMLVKYPRSIYLQEARDIIRTLRGDRR